MAFESVDAVIGDAVLGAFEDWSYNKFCKSTVESCADHICDTFVGRLDLYDQLSLAEDWYEETGGLLESVKKNGLRTAIEYGAVGEVDSQARSLFQEEAERVISLKEELEAGYESVEIREKDPFGWTPPVCVTEKEGLDGLSYRKVEGDINADVLSWKGDSGAEVYFVCYLKEVLSENHA